MQVIKVMHLLSLYEKSYMIWSLMTEREKNCVKLGRFPGSKLHYKTRLDSSINLGFGTFILLTSVLK